jgi:hypothetical protein
MSDQLDLASVRKALSAIRKNWVTATSNAPFAFSATIADNMTAERFAMIFQKEKHDRKQFEI